MLIKCNFLYCIGLQVTLEALDEVASLSGVKSVGDDYLPKTVRERAVNELFQILMG